MRSLPCVAERNAAMWLLRPLHPGRLLPVRGGSGSTFTHAAATPLGSWRRPPLQLLRRRIDALAALRLASEGVVSRLIAVTRCKTRIFIVVAAAVLDSKDE